MAVGFVAIPAQFDFLIVGVESDRVQGGRLIGSTEAHQSAGHGDNNIAGRQRSHALEHFLQAGDHAVGQGERRVRGQGNGRLEDRHAANHEGFSATSRGQCRGAASGGIDLDKTGRNAFLQPRFAQPSGRRAINGLQRNGRAFALETGVLEVTGIRSTSDAGRQTYADRVTGLRENVAGRAGGVNLDQLTCRFRAIVASRNTGEKPSIRNGRQLNPIGSSSVEGSGSAVIPIIAHTLTFEQRRRAFKPNP